MLTRFGEVLGLPDGEADPDGEAVVRQKLGATFVREEPYTPPSRFN